MISVALPMRAQVNMDMFMNNRNVAAELKVTDNDTSEPISFASVYLTSPGDTVITDFTLTDINGKAEFKHVPAGRHILHIEMMGYQPYQKDITFKRWREQLGIIKLSPDAEFLEAAAITVAGNPVVVKKDTVEFNASSFRVGQNAMLEDLLRKMPGIEVDNDGKVTMNGEDIKEITVEGKTFFFNDPSTAVKNLPAQIVNKIKVIDKSKDEATFSGISTKEDKEKVMDVNLKEEYKQGWFGNLKIGGGATINGKENDNNLIVRKGGLYNGNGMFSGYTEDDQVVAILEAYNVTEPNKGMMHHGRARMSENTDYSGITGLMSTIHTAVNWNTERIKNIETNASINYRHNTKDGKQMGFRQSFQPDGPDLNTNSTYNGNGSEDRVSVSLEFKEKGNKNLMFQFAPEFNYNGNNTNVLRTAETKENGAETILNHTSTNTQTKSSTFGTSGVLKLGTKSFGKDKRSISLTVNYMYNGMQGDKQELSIFNSKKDTLQYKRNNNSFNINGNLNYVEPFGDHWALQLKFTSRYTSSSQNNDAFNANGSNNDIYTTRSRNEYLKEAGQILGQYSSKNGFKFQFGVQAMGTNNETVSTIRGQESIVGKGEWMFNWSPFASLRYKSNGNSVSLYYDGESSPVSNRLLIPSIDFSDPSRLSVGNIFLKQGFRHELDVGYSMNNNKTFTFFRIGLYDGIAQNSITNAVWFDKSGIRYSIPVNSLKPGNNLGAYLSLNQVFGKNKNFTFRLGGHINHDTSIGYQATAKLPGLDLDTFDYGDFMSNFWGNQDGDLFYKGESGFKESRTSTLNWNLKTFLKYTYNMVDVSLGVNITNRISKFSLDKIANTNTWDNSVFLNLMLTPGKGWELKTDLDYLFYKGYAAGYGKPEWQWNLSVSKNIKAFTLSLKAVDILNQTRNLTHNVSNEYVEDIYSNITGRFILFSVSYNFGKMNAAKNKHVQNTMWNLM